MAKEIILDKYTKAVLKTDNKERELISYTDLPDDWRSEFDYLDGEDCHSPQFFRYKGRYYDAVDAMPAPVWALMEGWHTKVELTFDSLLLIRFEDDCETVKVAYAFTSRRE